jgi:tetratricopeptide (TPR) repeat protein
MPVPIPKDMIRNLIVFYLFTIPALCYGQPTMDLLNQFKSDSEPYDKSRISYYINTGDLNPDDFEGYYSRGILNLQNGLYEEAVKNFRYLIHEQPDIVGADSESAEPYHLIAFCKYHLQQYDSAIYFYNRVIELDPTNVEAYNERAVALIKTGKYTDALNDFEKIIFYDKKNYNVYFNIGLTKYLLGGIDEALRDLKKVSRNVPTFEEANLLIGQIYLDEGALGNAERYFGKVLFTNPGSANAHYFSGYTKLLKGIRSAYIPTVLQAKEDFETAYELDPKFVDAYEKAAFIDLLFGDFSKMIEKKYLAMKYRMERSEFRNAATPVDLELWYILQKVIDKTGISKEEQKIGHNYLIGIYTDSTTFAFGQAAAFAILNPQSEFVKHVLLFEQIRQDKKRETSILLERFFKTDSTPIHLRALEADILCSRGRYTKGIAKINSLIKQKRDYIYLHYLLGSNYTAFGKTDSAIAVFNRVLKKMPENYHILYQRANAYCEQGDYSAALRDIKKYILALPKDPAGWYLQGKVYNLKEKPDSALIALAKCQDIAPYFISAYSEKAHSYMIQDRPNQAIRVYDRLMNDVKVSSVGLYYRADFYLNELKNVQWALDDYATALEINPFNTLVLEAIGDLYMYHEQEYDSALRYYEKCLEINENLVTTLGRTGECYYHLEDYSKATEYLSKALETDSLNVSLLDLMGHTFIKLNGYETGLEYFLKAADIEPVSATILGNAGWCYYLLGDYLKCIEYSQNALETDSTTYFAIANIALAHLRLGEVERALEGYKDYLEKVSLVEDYDNSGVIKDLENLIVEGIMVEEAQNILETYFGGED